MEKNLVLYIIFMILGFVTVPAGAEETSSTRSRAPLQACEGVLSDVYAYQLRASFIMNEVLGTLKDSILDVGSLDRLDPQEKQRLEDIKAIWQRRTGHSLNHQDVVIMSAQQRLIQGDARWRLPKLNDPVAESKAISADLFLTALEYVLDTEDHVIVNFVPYDPAVVAAKVVNEVINALEIGARDVDAFDRLPAAQKKQVVDLGIFFQRQTGQNLSAPKVMRRLLLRRAGSLGAPPFQKSTRDEAIALAKFISEDLYLAALEYVNAHEIFFAVQGDRGLKRLVNR